MTTTNAIQVKKCQAQNDVLKKFSRCRYTFADIEPDFVVGRTACALYLSLRYHAQNPNYIYERINKLGSKYDLRILLLVIDHIEHKSYLKELSQLTIRSNMTLMLCWTIEDAAMYLEKYKLSEDKSAEVIMEKPTSHEYENALDQYMIDALAECRTINRTDSASIVGLFDNFRRICKADPDELACCPGVGQQKAERLYNLLHRKIKRDKPSPKKNLAEMEPTSSQNLVIEEEILEDNFDDD